MESNSTGLCLLKFFSLKRWPSSTNEKEFVRFKLSGLQKIDFYNKTSSGVAMIFLSNINGFKDQPSDPVATYPSLAERLGQN